MTLVWPENFVKMTEMAEMAEMVVYVVKDTVDITVFAKVDIKQHRNTCFSSCPQFLWTNREVPPLAFENCRKFLWFKIQTPPPPPGSENVRILGGRPGWWSGLELTDTLSSSGTNRSIPLSTHFIANALIALITCFVISPDQALLRR